MRARHHHAAHQVDSDKDPADEAPHHELAQYPGPILRSPRVFPRPIDPKARATEAYGNADAIGALLRAARSG
jgi:hypothetical protein